MNYLVFPCSPVILYNEFMSLPRARLSQSISRLFQLLFELLSPGNKQDLISDFESRFAKKFGSEDSIAVCKARTAFSLILKHLEIPKNSEVMISALHIADFVNIIRLNGHTPVVVDLKENDLLIDLEDAESKRNGKTKVLLVTPLSGFPQDMASLQSWCELHDILLIEDFSQGFSTFFENQRAGSFGYASLCSLSLLKSVCTLQGGMILSKDSRLLERIREDIEDWSGESRILLITQVIKFLILAFATHPLLFPLITYPFLRLLQKGSAWFTNFQKQNKTVILRSEMPRAYLRKMSWQQAKLGLEELENFDSRENTRIERGLKLYKALKDMDKIQLPSILEGGKSGFWLFPILTKNRVELQRSFLLEGIDCSEMLLSHLPGEIEFQSLGFSASKASITRESVLFIPMYPSLSEEELEFIISKVRKIQ